MRKLSPILLVLTFSIASCMTAVKPSQSSEGAWVSKARMGSTKTGFGVGVVNDKIYVIGGHPFDSPQHTIADVSAYDPATDQWRSKQPMSGPLAWFGTAIYQDEIYVIGGAWFMRGSEIDEVRVYDPSANTWTSKASMPTARWGATANVVHEKIYVIGGEEATGVLDVNEVYDPATDTWSTKTPIPTPVTSYASAVVDDKIYIIGGLAPEANSASKQHINLIQIYDPEKDSWSSGTPMPNTQNAVSAGATTGIMAPKKIYVIGDGLNQVYNPSNDSWTIGEPIPNYANRLTNFDDAEVAVVNDQLYALGGVYESENGEVYSVNEQYTPIDYGTPDLTTLSPSTEPQDPIQFPEVFIVASVAIFVIVGAGLLVYFKKRRH